MRERLGEFIFDGIKYHRGEIYDGVPRFVILELDEDKAHIVVSSHIEHEDYNDVSIKPETAREMAAQLIKMADEIEGKASQLPHAVSAGACRRST